MLLADAFWFIAHDDTTGRSLLHRSGTAFGLASALLGELVLDERIGITGGAIRILDSRPPALRWRDEKCI